MLNKILMTLAVVALIGFPIAVLGYRMQLWHVGASFSLILSTLVLAAAVTLIALIMILIALIKHNGAAAYLPVLVLAAIPLLGIGFQAIKARSVPMIHHISTDLVNPVQFEKAVPLRGANSNSLQYTAEIAAQQKQAYPYIGPIKSDLDVKQAMNHAANIAEELGWEIVNRSDDKGLIEAVATTSLFAFKDDVAIRIRGGADHTTIDLRSVSRIGKGDMGTNAARIKRFQDKF